MATDKKITQLTDYPAAQAADVFGIVDLASGLLKKITKVNFLQDLAALVAGANLGVTNNANAITALAARVANLEGSAPTVANFPALKHLFLCNEASGGATFTDSAGGVIWSGSTPPVVTNNLDGTLNWTYAFDTMSGAWAVPASGKKIVVVAIGMPAASGSLIFGQVLNGGGASATKGFRLGNGTGPGNKSEYADGTTCVVGPTTNVRVGNGAAASYAMSIDIAAGATGFKAYDFDGATYHDSTTATAITPTTLVGESLLASFSANSGAFLSTSFRPALIAVFHFNAVPADMQTALSYMHLAALTPPYTKLLPPSWKGVV